MDWLQEGAESSSFLELHFLCPHHVPRSWLGGENVEMTLRNLQSRQETWSSHVAPIMTGCLHRKQDNFLWLFDLENVLTHAF